MEFRKVFRKRRQDRNGNEIPTIKIVNVPPPLDIVRDFMNCYESMPLPALLGISECPIVHRDGTVISEKGYDPTTSLYFHAGNNFRAPRVNRTPSPDEIKVAIALIEEVFYDFPFQVLEDGSCPSKVNTYGALLTAVLRSMITGPTPLALVRKPQAGTGSTLIARVIHAVATGRDAEIITAPREGEDWEKRSLPA